MEVVAFVGPSGTGKSHHAIGVAHTHKCDGIIDDGILIHGTRILAGTSAKNEENRIMAVRRAIFTEKEHADEVREALRNSSIRRLLIIATSDNMIKKIVKRLELDLPIKTVYIHEIASKAEIKKARHARLSEGKHIVPVPSVELKSHFTGYFADLPYNLLSAGRRQQKDLDRSIVRPAFSFYGKLLISDNAVVDIIHLVADKMLGIAKILDVKVRRRSDSSKGIVIYLEVSLYYGVKIKSISYELQERLKKKIEYMTAMNVHHVNVSVRTLVVKEKEKKVLPRMISIS